MRSKDNPRKFWSIISGAKNRQITEMEPNSVVVVPEKCCVILNNAFASFFNQSVSYCFPPPQNASTPQMDPIIIAELVLVN